MQLQQYIEKVYERNWTDVVGYGNKRRSSTAILSINGSKNRLIEQQQITLWLLQKKPITDKKYFDEELVGKNQAGSFREIWVWKLSKYEDYMELFCIFGVRDYDIRNKKGDCSISETSESITPSIQTLINYFKAEVFNKDEMETWNMSILTTFLPLSDNHVSNADVQKKIQKIGKRKSTYRKKLSINNRIKKMKQVEFKFYDFEYRGKARLVALFGICHPSGRHCTKKIEKLYWHVSTEVETFRLRARWKKSSQLSSRNTKPNWIDFWPFSTI